MRDVNNLLGHQTKTPQVSEIVVHSPNGQGNIDNSCRHFTVIRTLTGQSMSVNLNVDQGTVVTIIQPGVYSMSYSGDYNSSTSSSVAITRNATSAGASDANTLVSGAAGATNYPICIATTSYLAAGDKIRVTTPGNLLTGNTVNQVNAVNCIFRIVRVSP